MSYIGSVESFELINKSDKEDDGMSLDDYEITVKEDKILESATEDSESDSDSDEDSDSDQDSIVSEYNSETDELAETLKSIAEFEEEKTLIPEGMVLVDEKLWEEFDRVQEECEDLKKLSDEQEEKLNELKGHLQFAMAKIEDDKKIIEKMERAETLLKLSGKYNLLTLEDENKNDKLYDIPAYRRFLTLIAPVMLEFGDGRIRTYSQLLGKRFNEDVDRYSFPTMVDEAKRMIVQYVQDGVAIIEYRKDIPTLEVAGQRKIYLQNDKLLLANKLQGGKTRFTVLTKAKSKTSFVRRLWRAARIVLTRNPIEVPNSDDLSNMNDYNCDAPNGTGLY